MYDSERNKYSTTSNNKVIIVIGVKVIIHFMVMGYALCRNRLADPHKSKFRISYITFYNVGFEVFTAMTMKNGVFWDVTPCGSCKNLLHQGDKNRGTRWHVSCN
jgi:hypothetical protein